MLTSQKPVSGSQELEKNQVYSQMEDGEGSHSWCPVLGESWVQRGLSYGGKEEWNRKSGSPSLQGESPFPFCSDQSTTVGFSEPLGLTAPHRDFSCEGETSQHRTLAFTGRQVVMVPQSETL